MKDVVDDINGLIRDFSGLPEYVYTSNIIQTAKEEILKLRTESDYYRTLCEGYEKVSANT
jgi:hypothetical protein